MKLLGAIGSQLQSLYTYVEIDQYFQAAQVQGLKTVLHGNTGSKRVYAKEVLSSVSNDALMRIAVDLDLDLTPYRNASSVSRDQEPPGVWRGDNRFKLFISHVSKDKLRAARLKDACAVFGIAGFVAHEEIEPTKSWQDEIFRGLRTMDALVAVLSEGFKGSVFCQQEVGFALGRGTKIVTIRVD